MSEFHILFRIRRLPRSSRNPILNFSTWENLVEMDLDRQRHLIRTVRQRKGYRRRWTVSTGGGYMVGDSHISAVEWVKGSEPQIDGQDFAFVSEGERSADGDDTLQRQTGPPFATTRNGLNPKRSMGGLLPVFHYLIWKLGSGDEVMISGGSTGTMAIIAVAVLIRGAVYSLSYTETSRGRRSERGHGSQRRRRSVLAGYVDRWLHKHAGRIIVPSIGTLEDMRRRTDGLDVPIEVAPSPHTVV